MTAIALRKKLTFYLQVAEEKKIKAIYALVQDDIEQEERIGIKQYNKELADAEAQYTKGDFISNAEMKKKITQW